MPNPWTHLQGLLSAARSVLFTLLLLVLLLYMFAIALRQLTANNPVIAKDSGANLFGDVPRSVQRGIACSHPAASGERHGSSMTATWRQHGGDVAAIRRRHGSNMAAASRRHGSDTTTMLHRHDSDRAVAAGRPAIMLKANAEGVFVRKDSRDDHRYHMRCFNFLRLVPEASPPPQCI